MQVANKSEAQLDEALTTVDENTDTIPIVDKNSNTE